MAASHTLTARAGRVLVVDDEPSNRRFIRQVLEREGHEVLEAQDGEAALEIAREAPPDVVLLDVMRPGADCYATCAAIKRRPERSEEHTSELQSRENLVCRLLLEKNKS